MSSGFRVVAGTAPALAFERPREVLRARSAAEAKRALERAQEAVDGGSWIAGYLAYELGAALVLAEKAANAEAPLLALGVFDAPRETELPDAPAPDRSGLAARAGRERYDAAIASLQRAIYEGDVYQVNYTVPFDLAVAGDPFAFYAHVARRTGAAFQAYAQDGDRAILSWSPELFLSFEGSRVVTRPMKGTAPLDRIADLQSPKNRAEHLMIVDLLRNDLHRLCDRVEVERFFDVERYPTFATMTSTIAGELRPQTSMLEILRATFPCGSVTGAPKRAAMSFIASHETAPRGAYCGSVGFLSPQRRGWWNVAIRTAQIDRSTGLGRFDAGGGIVADSQAAEEWNEIELKARFLQPEGFALLETFAGDAGEATLEAHRLRLERSARAFGIPLSERTFAAFEARPGTIVRVRAYAGGRLEVRAEAAAAPPAPVAVCTSGARVRSDDPFLQHKTTWRPAHEAARADAQRRGCFDALLRNERDELTEGWRTNLFAERDGTLWTPPLSSGVLPGILRANLLASGRARERILRVEDLREAQALYVGNSARGLLRARLTE